jgi:hypothetical protein
MSLFQVEEQKNEHRERARAMLLFANQVSEEIKRLYDMGREMMWNVPGYKVEDAQKILNELRLLAPPGIYDGIVHLGGDVELFKYHGSLGTFLASVGIIKAEEVSSPVPYELVGGSIVLTGDRYPTEPIEPPIEPMEPGESGEPGEPPTEPTELPAEPVVPVESPTEQPVESIAPVEPPTEPTGPPVEPIAPVEQPTEPTEPTEPTGPPVEPIAPVEQPPEPPEPPVEPIVPVEQPTEPV